MSTPLLRPGDEACRMKLGSRGSLQALSIRLRPCVQSRESHNLDRPPAPAPHPTLGGLLLGEDWSPIPDSATERSPQDTDGSAGSDKQPRKH